MSRGLEGRPLVPIVIVFATVLFLSGIECPTAAGRPPADQKLDVTGGKQDGQDSYGGMGYAVRYSVPNPSQTWWAVSVFIHGESYGTPQKGNEFFTISFMDAEGRLYSQTEHPKTIFTSQPDWQVVRITPTQLPSEFWVIVDFKATQQEGVFIGFAKTGGQQSRLTDSDYTIKPIADDKGAQRPVDWCIALKVRNKYKGKMVRYDPEGELIHKPKTTPTGPELKTQESDHFVFQYQKIDDIWGVSVLRLLEAAREGLEQNYGLKLPDKVVVSAGMQNAAPTAVTLDDSGKIGWNLKARNEFLPRPRGGVYNHIFGFCRELARMALRDTFSDHRIMPAGLEEGLAAYLGAEAVRHVEMRCGQKLWPVRFSYLREEGPMMVAEWIEEQPTAPERRYAGLLMAVDRVVGRDRQAVFLKGLFGEPVKVRSFVKRLSQELQTLEEVELPEDLFAADLLDPPFLWLFSEPNLKDMASFHGQIAKRSRNDVILSYDDNSSETMEYLVSGNTMMYCAPPGDWNLSSLRVYGVRSGDIAPEAGLTVRVLKEGLEPVGEWRVAADVFKSGKPGWRKLGGLPGVTVKGPFLIFFDLDDACFGKLKVGCDAGGQGGHCFRLVPGAYAEPPQGAHDWMVRLFLTDLEGRDRKTLDKLLREFKRTIP